MSISDTSLVRASIVTLSLLIVCFFSTPSFALPSHTLSRGEWSLISIPAVPGSTATVEFLFADDLPVDRYGPAGEWMLFAFDTTTNAYRELALSDTVAANTGYWIIQLVEASVQLDVPDSLSPLVANSVPGCPTGKLCATQSLIGNDDATQWNLVGASLDTSIRLTDTRFQSDSTACATGCDPTQATSVLIGPNRYRYTDGDYALLGATSVLNPWDGIWLNVIAESPAINWLLPISNDTSPSSFLSPAEKDAIRLLLQASFGPNEAAIENVLELGGPAQWIDAQLALPVQLHLPIVKQLFPNQQDNQEGRYRAFWRQALRADDQLRQRVAFALSQIMVVSDKHNSIKKHGELTASYNDILLNNAFGNYRDLLQDITLSPTMGLFLSMLGNEKPNSAKGVRADENYARELMQLFSIGLVELNLDGTERAGIATYTQTDVENLARVFTGWFWNVDRWKPNARSSWRPNRITLEQPMKAFEDHHDRGAKTVLGTVIPAGQNAATDLNMALDTIFNHPNVGPFIGKQLIKRLVTSNPSNAYVRRVASIFNDNGSGVRGDLAAVVRAILLDEDARSSTLSERTDFGKLREPLLRYAHMWRAFRVTDPILLQRRKAARIPLIAPLTAPSVFSFYSPNYAPPGAISAANLVAPEFQINSESGLNISNSTMMRVVQKQVLVNKPLSLNLEKELQLLSNTKELIDHLDRLLTAGGLTTASRRIITEYIDTNRGKIKDDRLLRDVIGLLVTSTEFAIQR